MTLRSGHRSLQRGHVCGAVSCDEVINMVRVNVPVTIIARTMVNAGREYPAEDLDCLESNGAPELLVEIAREYSPPPPPREPEERWPTPDSEHDKVPRIVEETLALVKVDPLAAAVGLAVLLEDDEWPRGREVLSLSLGHSLLALDLPTAAGRYYMKTVKHGPYHDGFSEALAGLVEVSRRTGDFIELTRIVHRIPPEAWPESVSDELSYLSGLRAWESDDSTRALKHFAEIPTHSERYAAARSGRPGRSLSPASSDPDVRD